MHKRPPHSQPLPRLRALLIAGVLASLSGASFAADAKDPSNVTAAVAAEVKSGHLTVTASNEKFGDTAPGVPKKLRVEYRIGSESLAREVPENGQIDIAAPAGQTLVVTKAVYGPADGSPVGNPGDVAEDPSAVLETLPGFTIAHVLRSNGAKNGSWICMAKDPKGRLLLGGQRGQPITRLTIQDGKVIKSEVLHIPVSETMGMLFVDNVLYLDGHGSHGFALYRCKDTKGDDSYDDVEFLREWHGGAGEHGAHALVLGPDRKLYAVCGNFTAIPKDLAPSSPHRVYADDLALKRMEDGNGFGAGNPPPGGFIARMDLDGGNVELFASGERNTYDIAFNADGELFGFDSDMEWDWGAPWYRPIRVFHAVRGGDQGFREGSGKWPEYYADSLPASVTVGIGCPTGVGFATGAHFPAKYQKALLVCDWTYGRLIAVHLKPNGATYGGSWENLVAPKSLHTKGRKTPLNITDELIGDDGALYFITGGRGTVADLFRVSYTGAESATPLPAAQLHDSDGSDARDLRHKLEAFNVQADPAAVDAAWPQLGSPDRFIRYAARLAIERNPVVQWQAKALAEKRPDAAFTALLALARLGAADTQPAILKALAAIPSASLSEEQLLNKLRVIEVSIARQGVPTGELAKLVIADVDSLYPAKTEFPNRELCQILLALDAPGAVARTVALIQAATTQEEQLTYVADLRNIKTGWTIDLRRTYLSWWDSGRSNQHPAAVVQWFTDAGIGFNNGSSFKNMLGKALKDAKASLSPEEVAALGDVDKPQAVAKAPAEARKFVREWTTADIQPLLDQVSKGRDFARGKAGFEAGQCVLCHRYGEQGGAVGPDLTAVATRFKRQDILESITEPSKVIAEQYASSVITTSDGNTIAGRVVQDTEKTVVIVQNPFAPALTTTINKADIKTRELSKVSIMPVGLLNTFTKEEILDLLAYLESLGDPKHPDFSK
jgi:putative heme-binding domain-containing protein